MTGKVAFVATGRKNKWNRVSEGEEGRVAPTPRARRSETIRELVNIVNDTCLVATRCTDSFSHSDAFRERVDSGMGTRRNVPIP